MNLFLALTLSMVSPDLIAYRAENDAYCQNLYWQQDAENKLEQAGCDIEVVTAQVFAVRSGSYE
ncbi:hypothetical protein OAN96_00885 [Candidatus Gracilibacteria bacterium]|nr:hypothetical protein [Candidatus Gracilibacteria bacterium]